MVIKIRGAENGKLAVPVNNTLVSHTAFLAADTRPCVLMEGIKYVNLIEIGPVVIKIRGAENG